jgi:lysophospholipase L1-like esterase
MKKILLCDGDSWTAGDIVDPKIFGDRKEEVNHPDNRPYRLPKVWPHKLGKLLNIEVDNIARSASSNDAIVRRTLRRVIELLETYQSEEIFVIIGWSSHNIKHLFFDAFYEQTGGMYQDIEIQDEMINSFLTDEYLNIRKKIFKKESFRKFILNKDVWEGIHPNEDGHELWANELYNDLRDKI